MIATIWDNPRTLENLEAKRDTLRANGKRLSFDCVHLKCAGERAYCEKGLMLGQARDGSIALISVLRGLTSGSCVKCRWWESD